MCENSWLQSHLDVPSHTRAHVDKLSQIRVVSHAAPRQSPLSVNNWMHKLSGVGWGEGGGGEGCFSYKAETHISHLNNDISMLAPVHRVQSESVCALGVSWYWTDLACIVASFMKPNLSTTSLFLSPMTSTQPVPSSWSLGHCRAVVCWIGPLFLSGMGLFSAFSSSDSRPCVLSPCECDSYIWCVLVAVCSCFVTKLQAHRTIPSSHLYSGHFFFSPLPSSSPCSLLLSSFSLYISDTGPLAQPISHWFSHPRPSICLSLFHALSTAPSSCSRAVGVGEGEHEGK